MLGVGCDCCTAAGSAEEFEALELGSMESVFTDVSKASKLFDASLMIECVISSRDLRASSEAAWRDSTDTRVRAGDEMRKLEVAWE